MVETYNGTTYVVKTGRIAQENSGKLLPVVYCLTVRKDLPTYSRIFEVLHFKAEELGVLLDPAKFVCDFETALIPAIQGNFPNTWVQGCFFHFCQAVLRHVGRLGLRNDCIHNQELLKFRFGISMVWLCGPTTIMNMEGCHSRMNCGSREQGFYQFLQLIIDEQGKTETDVATNMTTYLKPYSNTARHLIKFCSLKYAHKDTSSLVLKARAFFCKMGPLIGWSSARFWRNHKHIAESNALLMLVFIDFRVEQLLEVSTCNTKTTTVGASYYRLLGVDIIINLDSLHSTSVKDLYAIVLTSQLERVSVTRETLRWQMRPRDLLSDATVDKEAECLRRSPLPSEVQNTTDGIISIISGPPNSSDSSEMDANEMHKIFTWYHRQCLSLTRSPRLELLNEIVTVLVLGVLRKELQHHLPLYQNERNSSHEEASAAGDVPSAAHGEAIDAGNAPKLAL
ncbi:conserved hypothetical protein [Trichinella spiralis]|uniref:hypothetical protein n=1 Tax=Trichinella spiralis TaxID=6334 RepID=UPI0001EFCD50|nr:conserved hypothetical protein [Trichinella spiralis]